MSEKEISKTYPCGFAAWRENISRKGAETQSTLSHLHQKKLIFRKQKKYEKKVFYTVFYVKLCQDKNRD